mmetsp:Transcript_29534/g.57590  ORF Transcript_29534/g.57590 Transcript_29534/m.57590 type:complete len:323 (+) Transcript_29534:107-1075(+)
MDYSGSEEWDKGTWKGGTWSEEEVPNPKILALMCDAIRRGDLSEVKRLVEAKASVDGGGGYYEGNCPLLEACQGSLEIVKVLVQAKANIIEYKDSIGYTPLMAACMNGGIDIAKYLVERKANVEEISFRGEMVISRANCGDNLDVLKCLIEIKAKVNGGPCGRVSPLTFACWKGWLDAAKHLIEAKASVNGHCDEDPPIMEACTTHFTVVEYLAEQRAELECEDSSGCTPFHYACKFGALDVAQYLVELKINVFAAYTKRMTSLERAREGRNEEAEAFWSCRVLDASFTSVKATVKKTFTRTFMRDLHVVSMLHPMIFEAAC